MVFEADLSLGCFRDVREQVAVKTALASHKTFHAGRAFKGTLPQRNTGYHINLDDSDREKIRRWLTKGFAGGTSLMAGAAPEVDIGAVGAVVVTAVATT
jgi:hypothetical protein